MGCTAKGWEQVPRRRGSVRERSFPRVRESRLWGAVIQGASLSPFEGADALVDGSTEQAATGKALLA